MIRFTFPQSVPITNSVNNDAPEKCLQSIRAKYTIITLKAHSHREQECIPVGCVPPACWPYPSMHYAEGGVCPGGCLPLVPGKCIPACNGADTPLWTDTHLSKHNLRKLRLRAVKTESESEIFLLMLVIYSLVYFACSLVFLAFTLAFRLV